MPRMTPWHAVAEALAAEGVEYVFGLPGNPLHLVADIVKHTGIDIVLVRHEHSAAACAYAYARLTGGAAVCFGNPGPGITNMATALLEASSGCLPVIALTNGVSARNDGKGAFQELDSVALMRPVTKWAVRPHDPATIPWVMQRAFSLAVNGRPGAVFIDLPSDVALTETEIPSYVPHLGRQRTRPDAAVLEAAAELLARARRPLLLCGSGAVFSAAFREVRELSDALGMPVFTTPGGRGIYPEDEDLALGQVGLYFTEVGKSYYDRADLVLSVGSRLEEFSTGAWRYFPKGAKLVQLDVDAETIAINWQPDVALIGDAALALGDLVQALPPIDGAAREKRIVDIVAAKQRYFRQVEAECAERRTPIRTRQVMAAINKVFDRDTILVNENGGADLWSYYWPYYRVRDVGDCVPMAEQTAMGMGVIGAIGAKLAKPEKKVVCITGDGGLQMAMMELATAAEQKCGVTWVVLNNHALGWPQYNQILANEQQVATNFVVSPDFAKLAEAQSCKGLKVTDPDEVEAALAEALAANEQGVPALVDFEIEKHDYPPHFVAYHHLRHGLD